MLKPGCTVFLPSSRGPGTAKYSSNLFHRTLIHVQSVNTAPMCIVSPQCNRKSPRLALWTQHIKHVFKWTAVIKARLERNVRLADTWSVELPQRTVEKSVKDRRRRSRIVSSTVQGTVEQSEVLKPHFLQFKTSMNREKLRAMCTKKARLRGE